MASAPRRHRGDVGNSLPRTEHVPAQTLVRRPCSIGNLVVAVAAVQPYQYNQVELARLSGFSRSSISRHVLQDGNQWISTQLRDPDNVASGNVLYAKPGFYYDRQDMARAIVSRLPRAVLEEYVAMRSLFIRDYSGVTPAPKDLEFGDWSSWPATVIGMHGNVCRLERYGTWKEGSEGWDLLLRTSIRGISVDGWMV